MPAKKVDPVQRFWGRVLKAEGCWLWTGGKTSRGYGRLKVKDGPLKDVYAHRFSYRLHFGPIPDGAYVCHHCDNPPCVRPDHLFLGSPADNTRDARRKGRMATGDRNASRRYPERRPSGEQHANSRLTVPQVVQIRERFDGGEEQKALAEQFGVSGQTIFRIVHKLTWKRL